MHETGTAKQNYERVPIRLGSLDVPTGGWVRVPVNDPDIREVLSHSDVIVGDHLGGQDTFVFPLGYDPLHTRS